jgi:hypothetical protein
MNWSQVVSIGQHHSKLQSLFRKNISSDIVRKLFLIFPFEVYKPFLEEVGISQRVNMGMDAAKNTEKPNEILLSCNLCWALYQREVPRYLPCFPLQRQTLFIAVKFHSLLKKLEVQIFKSNDWIASTTCNCKILSLLSLSIWVHIAICRHLQISPTSSYVLNPCLFQ